MRKTLTLFIVFFIAVFGVDQAIKLFFVDTNFYANSEFIDLVLTYNRGVAFSMFAFLGEWLKYLQILLLVGIFLYLIYEKDMLRLHSIAIGAIFGAGSSNIFDRFIHHGVVDYIFWHKWFEFAVFNLADVVINLSVLAILVGSFFKREAK